MTKSLDWLVKVNDCLEELPENVIDFYNSFIKSAKDLTQEYVDKVCEWMAWWVNVTVERLRQKTIKTLIQQYSSYFVVLKWVQVIQDVMKNPIKAIGSFFGMFSKPVQAVIEFITVLAVELPRLAENLAKIVEALPPSPPTELGINFNAFKKNLKINTVTMKDITSGGNFVPPEKMFPEPESPFGKAAFEAAFSGAKSIPTQDRLKEYLPNAIDEEVKGKSKSASAISQEINKQINNGK